MKKNWILFFATLFLFQVQQTETQAQSDETIFGKSGLRLTGVWGGPSSNLSKFGDDYGYFNGGFGGLEFNKDFFVGWGGYRLTNDILNSNTNLNGMEFKYHGFMLGYAPGAHKAIHPKISALVGTGTIDITSEGRDKVAVIVPSAGVEINIFKWFRVGLEGGYRFVTDSNFISLKDEDLSAPFGEIQFKFGISWGNNNRRVKDKDWDFD